MSKAQKVGVRVQYEIGTVGGAVRPPQRSQGHLRQCFSSPCVSAEGLFPPEAGVHQSLHVVRLLPAALALAAGPPLGRPLRRGAAGPSHLRHPRLSQAGSERRRPARRAGGLRGAHASASRLRRLRVDL